MVTQINTLDCSITQQLRFAIAFRCNTNEFATNLEYAYHLIGNRFDSFDVTQEERLEQNDETLCRITFHATQ